MPQTLARAKTKQKFYENLENEMRNIPIKEKLLIMGVLNARIGNKI